MQSSVEVLGRRHDSITHDAQSSYQFRYRDMDKATQRSTLARSIQGFHFDFISILALVETLAIDLLPIRWQPALNSIGQGGTAKVLQSPVDLQLSLAFKRPLESTVRRPESGSFELLMSELLVLSNPATRYHPHLVMLEGICLEIDAEEGAVSPIFVFEKAREGDLHHFMSSSGMHLGIQERLDLCKDIATAIQVLHACRKHCNSAVSGLDQIN